MDAEDRAALKRDRTHEVIRGLLIGSDDKDFAVRTARLDPRLGMFDTVRCAWRNDYFCTAHDDARSFTGGSLVARGATS